MKHLKLFEDYRFRAGDYVIVNAPVIKIFNEPCEIIDVNVHSNSLSVKPLISILGVKLIQNYEVVKKISKDELDFYIQSFKYNL